MNELKNKTTWFLMLYVISFLLFCLSFRSILGNIETTSYFDLILLFLAIAFQCVGILFSAILTSNSKWLLILPLVFSLLGGMLLFGSAISLLLALGAPLALLFWSVRKNTENALHFSFSSITRRPLIIFYLLFFLFSSIAITPTLMPLVPELMMKFSSTSADIKKEDIPDGEENISAFPKIERLLEIYEMKKDSILPLLCEGNGECEEAIEREVSRYSSQDETIPRGLNPEASSELSPLENLRVFGLPIEFSVAMILFALLTPFSILFSFLTVSIGYLIFRLLSLFGVFRIEYEKVQKEIVV